MSPAAPFIPQRPPMIMVDNIIFCDEIAVKTDFTVPKDCIFIQNNQLGEAGLMENIAQTCAARIGWLNQDRPVRIGVIGSISNFEITKRPEVGSKLVTTVTIDNAIFDVIIVHAETQCNGKNIAHCDMKVFVVE